MFSTSSLSVPFRNASSSARSLVSISSRLEISSRVGLAPTQNSPMALFAKNSSESLPAVGRRKRMSLFCLASITRTESATVLEPHPVRCAKAACGR